MKKSQPLPKLVSPSYGNVTTTGQAPTKIARILAHLMKNVSLNRFEAELLGDHCLHSTISRLSNDHGLLFRRHPESVPNGWGQSCRVTRYKLADEQQKLAENVLALLGGNAGAKREAE
jgi:hypothetical protein